MSAASSLERVSRAWFRRRLELVASAVGAQVEIDIAPTVRVGRRIVLEIAPGSRSRLRIGHESRLWDDVTLALRGGELDIGPWVDLRRGVVLNVSGALRFGGSNLISWGTVVHCAGRVDVGARAGTAEYVSIIDSTHYHSDPDVPFHYNVVRGEVTIGENAWIGAKATVLRDSHVGAYAIVAAGTVVRGEVPTGHVVVRDEPELRPRDLPWASEHDGPVAHRPAHHRHDLGEIDDERSG